MTIRTKATYDTAINKLVVRNFLFSYFKCTNIIGLAGPDINRCVKWYLSKGYTNIEIWENTPQVVMHQMMNIKYPVRMRFGDILHAEPDRINTIYDCDFCCTIKHMKDHIVKFKHNFIMTFSLRAGITYTLEKFFKDRNEKIIGASMESSPIPHRIFYTEQGTYIFTPYFDTSAMCCIAKIN